MDESNLRLLIDKLTRLFENRSEILEAYVFGSVARLEDQAHSDVDVAVYLDLRGEEPSAFGNAAALTTDVMEALGRDDVDVVVLNQATPLLYHRVLRDGRRFLSRDLRATTTREGYALSRYCDYVPQLRKIEAAHRLRIERGLFGR